MFRLFAVVFDVWLTAMEAMPPHKKYKGGKGFPKPRMADAVKPPRGADQDEP
jgi:hypothetical protein